MCFCQCYSWQVAPNRNHVPARFQERAVEGLVPQCKACEEGLSVEEWLVKTCPDGASDAHYGGWDEEAQKEIWICEGAPREED